MIWLPSSKFTKPTLSGRMPSRAGFQYFVQDSLDLELIDEQDVTGWWKHVQAFKLDDILDATASARWPRLYRSDSGCWTGIQHDWFEIHYQPDAGSSDLGCQACHRQFAIQNS